MRNFVSTYDYSRKTVALGVNINAPEGVKIDKRLLPMEIAGLVIAGILVLALLILLAWCICKCTCQKKEEDRHAYHKTNDNIG